MDGWMDEWMNGCMEWMDGWIDSVSGIAHMRYSGLTLLHEAHNGRTRADRKGQVLERTELQLCVPLHISCSDFSLPEMSRLRLQTQLIVHNGAEAARPSMKRSGISVRKRWKVSSLCDSNNAQSQMAVLWLWHDAVKC